MSQLKSLRRVLASAEPQFHKWRPKVFFPTGSTLLNLAASDSRRGGWAGGTIVNICGASTSGKTVLALSVFAEASKLACFDEHNFYYDDAEHAAAFDLEEMFGRRAAERIRPPKVDPDTSEPMYSETLEEFQGNIIRALRKGPCIYVLDSLDSLTTEAEEALTEHNVEAREKGSKTKGSFSLDLPKKLSQMLRQLDSKLKPNNLLIILSQTRANIDPMSHQKKVRSGGNALKFYAFHELWLSVGTKIKDKKYGLESGAVCIAKMTKNKVTGKKREVEYPVFHGFGVDDIGSMVDYLVDTKHWSSSGRIIPTEVNEWLGIDSKKKHLRAQLIVAIEEANLERKLSKVVEAVWLRIEKDVAVSGTRKKRYT